MTARVNPRDLSQAELCDYLDWLTAEGKDDTPEFHQAYGVWEEHDD